MFMSQEYSNGNEVDDVEVDSDGILVLISMIWRPDNTDINLCVH